MVTLHGRLRLFVCFFFFSTGIKIIFSMREISINCKLQGNKEQSSSKKTTVDDSGACVASEPHVCVYTGEHQPHQHAGAAGGEPVGEPAGRPARR